MKWSANNNKGSTGQIREKGPVSHSSVEADKFCHAGYGGSKSAGCNIDIWMGFENRYCEPCNRESPNLDV